MPRGTRRVVTSRSNARLIEAAVPFVSTHDECIVIAPSHSAGEDFAHSTPASAGIHRLTLIQLAADVARPSMAALGLAPMTSLALEAVAARAVYLSRSANELNYFKPVAELPGFARALARTLGELRLGAVDCDTLARTGAPGGPSQDLARLLARYQTELEDRGLADLARVFELASQAAKTDRHRWLDLPIVLLDAPLETKWHHEFFRTIATRASHILVAISSDPVVFRDLTESVEDLDAAVHESPIEDLRRNLFEDTARPPTATGSCLEMFSAPGEGLEAVEIARRILRLARKGVAFDRIAILLRSPERYQPMIEDALRRAKIPAYFSRGSARPDTGGRAFLALLKCASDKCSASRFAEYLSLGQVPPTNANPSTGWVPPNDEVLPGAQTESDVEEPDTEETPDESKVVRSPAAWEKLLVDAAVIGGRDRWQRRLRGLEREYELRFKILERDDEARRAQITRKLDQLRELETFALPLIDILHSLPREARWGQWIENLSALARASLRHPEPVLAVLGELKPMSDVGPASLDEVAEVLSDRLSFLRTDRPERRYGRVWIASVDEARGRAFDFVFLPGLAEGIFPQRASEDPLLLDQLRREISASMLLRDDRVLQERERLKLASAAAKIKLIASYPRIDLAEARPRVPSFYALELPRAADGKLPELKLFERDASAASTARLNWPAPDVEADAIDDIEYDLVQLRRATYPAGDGDSRTDPRGSGRYLIEANKTLARSLRARYWRWQKTKWAEADGFITHSAAALTALGDHRLAARAWSPSSLQQFTACPYRFALYGIFALRPREDASPIEQLDPLTRGALFHEVQFALLNELKRRDLLPVRAQSLTEVLEIADAVLEKVAAKYNEELAPAIDRVWNTQIEDLRTDLRGWLQFISTNDDDWLPIHFELAFGLASHADQQRDPASSVEQIELTECGVHLRGSIDLVERNIMTGALRVTDHKTGKCPESFPLYVGGGRFLQPLLYGLAAEQMLGAAVEKGRLFYATQTGGYQHGEIVLNKTSRAFLTKLLANIDGAIAAGFLPPAPQKDACAKCDYRIVCGPYEELRSIKHKDRRDERFDPLTEIRAMA